MDKPLRLELGIGDRRIHSPTESDINISIDFYAGYNPEIVWDLAYGIPFGQTAETNHGPVLIEKGIFDDVYAEHMLEHIGRPYDPADYFRVGLWKLLVDIYDALKVGGTLRGAVPSYTDQTCFIDPTHQMTFHPSAFNYFGWHNEVNRDEGSIRIGWVPGFTPDDNRVFEPVEVIDHGNQTGFILKKVK